MAQRAPRGTPVCPEVTLAGDQPRAHDLACATCVPSLQRRFAARTGVRAATRRVRRAARAGCPTGRSTKNRRRDRDLRRVGPARRRRRAASSLAARRSSAARDASCEAPDAPSSRARRRRRRRRGARCAPTPEPARRRARRAAAASRARRARAARRRTARASSSQPAGAATWTWSSPTIARAHRARELGAPRDPGPEKRTRFPGGCPAGLR